MWIEKCNNKRSLQEKFSQGIWSQFSGIQPRFCLSILICHWTTIFEYFLGAIPWIFHTSHHSFFFFSECCYLGTDCICCLLTFYLGLLLYIFHLCTDTSLSYPEHSNCIIVEHPYDEWLEISFILLQNLVFFIANILTVYNKWHE